MKICLWRLDCNKRRNKLFHPNRVRYLSEINETIIKYDQTAEAQSQLASNIYSLNNTLKLFKENSGNSQTIDQIAKKIDELKELTSHLKIGRY